MKIKTTFSHRQFIHTAAAMAVGPSVFTIAQRRAHAVPANERITIGFIGYGKRTTQLFGQCIRNEDVQIVAVSDVVRERCENGQRMINEYYKDQGNRPSYKGCDGYNDFRKIIERDDIDAVVISTPDHWHAIPSVMSADAGKDIYCEKPMSLVIRQGRKMARAVRRNKVIFQTGSQQRSEFGGKFRQAVELIRNGRIGKVKRIHVGVGAPPVPCDLPEELCPEGTDWEMWNGPAPERGYNHELCPKGVHDHFPNFRLYREYAGGGLSDFGAHHFDIAQWALDMDDSGPVKIEPPEGDATSGLKFTYANGVEMFHGGPSGCTFEGTDGTIYVDRSELTSDPKEILEEPLGDNAIRVYFADNHMRNWIDCIRSREQPICTVETGHRTNSVCQLAIIGYELRRPLKWDPRKERFYGDGEANRLRDREIRAPWKL
ncbi:MAG: Gfo/Idh/MocA family oxidoreductase [bacterium]